MNNKFNEINELKSKNLYYQATILQLLSIILLCGAALLLVGFGK
jgi:hypothetical protein